jgi:hypothetical protein
MRTTSVKSVTEKPAYSKCKNLSIRIPRARDIAPITDILSLLSYVHLTAIYPYFFVTLDFYPSGEIQIIPLILMVKEILVANGKAH